MLTLDDFSEAHQSCESGENLPVEQPTRLSFSSISNPPWHSALKISAALRALADDVIEQDF